MLWIHPPNQGFLGIQYGESTSFFRKAPAPRLDTVDQAERTATFMAAEKQNTASTKAATRLSAMAKNLGPDSEGEDEEVGWNLGGLVGDGVWPYMVVGWGCLGLVMFSDVGGGS